MKEGLAKTRETLVGKVQNLFLGRTAIDEQLLTDLEEILIGGDVGVATAEVVIDRIRERVRKERFEEPPQLDAILREELAGLLLGASNGGQDPFAIPAGRKPHVIMIVGVNGVGKTTTIGKLAYNYRTAGKSVIIAAADTFRAAANEQLDIWAKRAEVDIVRQAQGADPAAVAFDAVQSAVRRNADVVIIDTAGRLHTKVNLMEELKKIRRVVQKVLSDAPHEVLLVLDASTGQNAIQQARQFGSAVGVTGLVLTKLDGTAKGGVVIAIGHDLHLPVRFIGIGERIDDLQPFDPKAFVDALFERN